MNAIPQMAVINRGNFAIYFFKKILINKIGIKQL